MGVPHDDDMRHAQSHHGIFDRRGGLLALRIRREGRNKRGDVADDENLARPRVEDDFGRHTRIAAPNEKNRRLLAFVGEMTETTLFFFEAFAAEMGVAFDELRRERNALLLDGFNFG